MSNRSYQIGFCGVAALVALRVCVGWHFFYEGMYKYKHPESSADNYFLSAKGPFAETFRELVEDPYGQERLNLAWVNPKKQTPYLETRWAQLREQFLQFYDLQNDKKMADRTLRLMRLRLAAVSEYLDGEAEQIAEYRANYDRLKKAEAEVKLGAPFQQKRIHDMRTKIFGQIRPWIAQINKTEKAYLLDMRSSLTAAQLAKGPLPPQESTLVWIDWLTKWTVMLVGFCLLVGLFTRLASFAGAGFLLLVILAQPALPYVYPPPHPSAGHSLIVNKEVIEMMVLVALMMLPVGRWGGLDFFIHHGIMQKLFPPKTKKTKKDIAK